MTVFTAFSGLLPNRRTGERRAARRRAHAVKYRVEGDASAGSLASHHGDLEASD
jgi:hypothetical protein